MQNQAEPSWQDGADVWIVISTVVRFLDRVQSKSFPMQDEPEGWLSRTVAPIKSTPPAVTTDHPNSLSRYRAFPSRRVPGTVQEESSRGIPLYRD
jgi:hypothetical protein